MSIKRPNEGEFVGIALDRLESRFGLGVVAMAFGQNPEDVPGGQLDLVPGGGACILARPDVVAFEHLDGLELVMGEAKDAAFVAGDVMGVVSGQIGDHAYHSESLSVRHG